MSEAKVTREQLEAKFAALQTGVESTVAEKRKTVVIAGAVGGLVLLLLFFALGRRSGKRKTTIVEIRRV